MSRKYWISYLLFFTFAGLLAWWQSNGKVLTGFLLFIFLTVPLLLWGRTQSRKIDPTKGIEK